MLSYVLDAEDFPNMKANDEQILIDHDSPSGFESIAESREYLLRMGRKEFEDTSVECQDHTGCHVVAPVSLYPRLPLTVRLKLS